MNKDPEVLNYLLNSMEEATSKLERAVVSNDMIGANKLKKFILDLSNKIAEELK